MAFNERYSVIIVLPMHFSQFWANYIARHVMETHKSGTPSFLCRSLLLSSIVFNDNDTNLSHGRRFN